MSPRQARGELLADVAYRGVRDRILRLEMAPGSAIDEVLLVDELGVGRTPIREAIKRLALEELVVVYPRRGTFVADITMTDLGHISELRSHLEACAAHKAALSAPPSRARASELLAELNERASASLDTVELMKLDRRVHHLIYELSGNPFLASVAGQYYNLSVRIWYLLLSQLPHLAETVFEHRRLLEAIRDGDAASASELAEQHVAKFASTVRGAF